MRKVFLFILSVMIVSIGYSQKNLVGNPSFEIYNNDSCPNAWGQINYATGWNASRGTPDYYNTCSTSPYTSVPSNYFGDRTPASGNAYAGIIARWAYSESLTETIEAQLTTPLIKGTRYYVSFKVSLGGYYEGNYCGINKIGSLFSTVHYNNVSSFSPQCNYNCAQIWTDSIITDTLDWTRIKGSFVADSNYSFINVGRFNYNSVTDSIQIKGAGCNAYYFIDDIAVSEDSVYAYNYSWIATGINEIKKDEAISYPNPFKNFITIEDNENGLESLRIYNVYGQLLKYQGTSYAQSYTWNLQDLPSGIYNLTIQTKNLKMINKIIIKL